MRKSQLCLCALMMCTHAVAAVVITDSLSTPADLVATGDWLTAGGGFKVTWAISQNQDLSWHYSYTFSDEGGQTLEKLTSHFIISLSDNIAASDIYSITGDYDDHEFGTFGVSTSDPGLPAGITISGIKIELNGGQTSVAFDSTRAPMWGDFYAKNGTDPSGPIYAYNVDIGIAAANAFDYFQTPVDSQGIALAKMLVPDTVPEPATILLLAFSGLITLRKRN